MKPSPTVMSTTYETLCINLTWLCDTPATCLSCDKILHQL